MSDPSGISARPNGGEQHMDEAQRHALDAVLAQWRGVPGALLPILHGVQGALGFIPSAAVEPIAADLNLSRAEVHGVITYYHHFRREPAGTHVVQICRAEACQAVGGEALWDHACSRLGTEGHGTTPDGEFTLEPVYCLGLCASSPAMSINAKVHARVGPDRFDLLVALARGAGVGVPA